MQEEEKRAQEQEEENGEKVKIIKEQMVKINGYIEDSQKEHAQLVIDIEKSESKINNIEQDLEERRVKFYKDQQY